jgi:hypothetical protein
LNNANLIVSNATCIMRLIDDTMTAWEADAQGVYAIRFAAIESFV